MQALAWYTVVYILFSFIYHLMRMIHHDVLNFKGFVWLAVKVPVFLFALLTILRAGSARKRHRMWMVSDE